MCIYNIILLKQCINDLRPPEMHVYYLVEDLLSVGNRCYVM